MIDSAIVADFIGGPASGQNFPLPDDWSTIYLPVLLPEASIGGYWIGDPTAPFKPITRGTAIYRRTGIRDDGRRVYAYDARVSTG